MCATTNSFYFLLLVLGFCTFPTLMGKRIAAATSTTQQSIEGEAQQPFSYRGLYFDSSDVPALRAKANTTHRLIYERICDLSDSFKRQPEMYLPPVDSKVFVSKWNEEYGNWLAVLAFYCVLQPTDIETYALLVIFMDRMASYPSWFIDPLPTDEVPVSHSLTGFATAFDFLKNRLTDQQQQRYASKLYNVTKLLYNRGKYRWWGRTYIQNHVASITMAIFNGAFVLRSHYKEEAAVWCEWAFEHLKKTLILLDTVVDGSMDEGTAYGTYTTRSLTQFLYVAKRHYNVDLTNFYWLKQHYDFLLGTTLPGYAYVIGIADSARQWNYGPESQLAFLESFVLKNGEANWLISKIRTARRKSTELGRFCTEHTEYLWYNPSIREKSPFLGERGRGKLFRFSDAGVVTYGAGRENNETLLSFKSGPLHGRAVYVAMETKLLPWLVSWKKSLNPGHEHPDQNSFVFYPRGVPMITEAYYGPKFTFLNNELTFGPSPFAQHFPPNEGQLGESFQWLDWASQGIPHAWAEVVTAVEDDGMVLFSGEAVGAYHPHLQLKSVYRMLVLLNPDVLLVVDHVELSPGSFLKYTNSYFNNIHYPFKVLDIKHLSNSGANAVLEAKDGEKHEIRWTSSPNELLSANAGQYGQTMEKLHVDSQLHFLNLSIPLSLNITRAAYVFSGPRAQVRSVAFSNISDSGVIILVQSEGGEYTIALATKYADVLARRQFLGTLGYGWVKEPNGNTHYFTAKQAVEKSYSVSFNEQIIREQKWSLQINYAIVLGSCSVYFLCIWAILHRFRWFKSDYVSARIIAIVCFLLLLVSLGLLVLIGSNGDEYYNIWSTVHAENAAAKSSLPPVFVTTLGSFGSSLVAALFKNSTDFLYISPSYSALKVPKAVSVAAKNGKCCLEDNFTSAFFQSTEHISQVYVMTDEELNQLKYHRLLYPNAMTVLHTEQPTCCVKVPSLQSAEFDSSLKLIHIAVRDPLMWVAYQMGQTTENKWDFRKHFMELMSMVNCTNASTSFPEYKQLLGYLNSDDNLPLHRILAMLWKANTAMAQRLLKDLPSKSYLHVYFEDIIENPVQTAEKIYSFLGLPLPLATEFHILQQTQSSIYSRVGADTSWRTTLTAEQIKDI